MRLTSDDFVALVETANLAPSVHNTQPTRWRLNADGSIFVFEDTSRRLPIADPTGRDAGTSHGAAIEGFSLACGAVGTAVYAEPYDGPAEAGLRPVVRLTLSADGVLDPLGAYVPARRTYRGTFVKRGLPTNLDLLTEADDVTLVRTSPGVERLAQLNDEGSLRTYRDQAYRAELRSWTRLSRRDPNWALDGLNAEALEMSGFVAAGAGVVLAPGVFEALDRIGIGRLLVAEAAVVQSAPAVALFHRPATEDPLLTGRRFYRLWLEFESLGLSAAPMSVLADDEQTSAIIAREFDLPAGRRLINVFRLGVPPPRNLEPKPRLPRTALVV